MMKDSCTERRRASFTTLELATREELALVRDAEVALYDDLPRRIVEQLEQLDRVPNGHPISQLEHCLQAATRAFRDGRSEAYVVCVLLHDIGDVICPHNHAALAAMILKPFVDESLRWMVENHPVFQQYHFYETLGRNPNQRDKYRDSPYYEMTVEFCERYDQCSFDPEYDRLPLSFFKPMIERIFENRGRK
jgi:predicted HD phosphohydrolase